RTRRRVMASERVVHEWRCGRLEDQRREALGSCRTHRDHGGGAGARGMTMPIWTRATLRLARHTGRDPRYLLHQAVCTLWDGEVRPVWRLVRRHGDAAEIVVLSRGMMTGRACGGWGCVESVSVGPVHRPSLGERAVFVGSVVATAEVDDERRVLTDAYPEEEPGELYTAYLQRRLGDIATVRWAEVYRISRTTVRRHGRSRGIMYYDAADVGGTLIVHDPAGLVDALCDGIG